MDVDAQQITYQLSQSIWEWFTRGAFVAINPGRIWWQTEQKPWAERSLSSAALQQPTGATHSAAGKWGGYIKLPEMAREAKPKAWQAPTPPLCANIYLSGVPSSLCYSKGWENIFKASTKLLPAGKARHTQHMVQGCSSAPLCSSAHHLMQLVTHISAQQLPSSSITLFYRTQGTTRSSSTMLGTWEAPGLSTETSAEAWWYTPINRDPLLNNYIFHWTAVSFVNTKVLLWQVITYWINFLPSIGKAARTTNQNH